MGQFDERLKPIVQRVSDARKVINEWNQVFPDGPQKDAYSHFVHAFAHIEARISSMDPFLVPGGQVQALTNAVNNMIAALNSFRQSPNNWQNLTGQLDNMLATLAAIPAVGPAVAADQYSAALSDFLRRSDQAAKQSEDRATKMEERVKALDASATAVDARAKEIQGQVNQEKARLDKVILDSQGLIAKMVADEQARYSEAEKQRAKAGADGDTKRDAEAKVKLAELTTKFDQMVAANQTEFSAITNTHRKSAEETATALKQQLQEASRLVGLIANTGMAGHYQIVADREWRWMWWMRLIAGVFFTGAIAAIAFLIWTVHSAQVDWEMVVFRFALVVVVLVPAFYFARESGRHLQREAHNRRIELELSALQPFIARLPEKEAQEIIKKKADQYFGQEPPPDQDENNLLRDVSLRGDQVLKILTKVLAAWRGK